MAIGRALHTEIDELTLILGFDHLPYAYLFWLVSTHIGGSLVLIQLMEFVFRRDTEEVQYSHITTLA